MLIWLLKIGEPVPVDSKIRKLRTAMLADRLAERGHEVVWWTSAFDHHRKKMIFDDRQRFPLHPRIQVQTLKGIAYRGNVSPRRYLDHWIISKKFKKWAERAPLPDLIVASMPDYHLAYEAVSFARRKNVPILVDIRDQWPDIFLEVAPVWTRPLLKMMLFRDYQKLAFALGQANGIISATNTWLHWGLKKASRSLGPNDRTFYLGAPKFQRESSPALDDRISKIAERAKGRFVATFIGTFSHVHNPSVIVRAAALLKRLAPAEEQPLFVLAGNGPFYNEVRALAEKLENVVIPGWLNNQEIASILSVSSAGIVPFGVPTDQFPNKAFTYLSAGLPVLACDHGDLSNLLVQYGAGFHFERNDEKGLSRLLIGLARDRRMYDRMRGNATRFFDERLNAERIYASFAEHIEAVARQGRGGAPSGITLLKAEGQSALCSPQA